MHELFVLRETTAGERRVPLVPETVEKLAKLGAHVTVEAGIGASLGLDDAAYTAKGAVVAADRAAALRAADMVLGLRPPEPATIRGMRSGAVYAGMLEPFRNRAGVEAFAAAGVSALSLELLPRTTIAQKMDIISSQANLGGYVAVVLAAERIVKVFPMMMTPAGTIQPTKVLIIGVGVAGLQAIATAKRLGARVEAFDTRPVVKEQVQSLGAKFVEIDLGETGQTKDGYAKELTPEQVAKQRAGMAKRLADSDVVITTAQVFGKKAPVIVTADMLRTMRPGSVVVDMAVETGGNVEGSVLDQEVRLANGVRVLGLGNLPGHVADTASRMVSSNLGHLVEHFWDKKAAAFALRLEDELIAGMLVTHGGRVVHAAAGAALGLPVAAGGNKP